MDKNVMSVVEKRINHTIKALNDNNINGYYVESKAQLLEKIKELMPKGSSVSSGGSITLDQTGVRELLRNGDYTFYDRDIKFDTVEEKEDVERKAFFCDFFLTGTNAVTLDGKLYNVDGRGNRVSAIIFGPKKVIVVVGYNKIVENLEQAEYRLKTIAAPANTARIGLEKTGCYHTGVCTNCHGDQRVCCQYVVTGFSRDKDKYHVFFLPEELGY